MRLFTQKKLNQYVTDEVIADRLNHMEASARKAAVEALHYYTCVRTIDTWRKILDEAEKSGDKYVSMAELIVKAGFKR